MSDYHDLVVSCRSLTIAVACPTPAAMQVLHGSSATRTAPTSTASFVLDLINRTLAQYELPDVQFMVSTNDVPLVDKYIFKEVAVQPGQSDRVRHLVPGQSFTSGAWGLTWPDWLSDENQAALDEKYPWERSPWHFGVGTSS